MLDYLLNIALDVLLNFLLYSPLVAAAYYSFIILRFPDLSIETSWAVSGIICLIIIEEFFLPPILVLFISIISGVFFGLVTALVFRLSHRQKLMSGLITYFIVLAIGYRILGSQALILTSERFSDTPLFEYLYITGIIFFVYLMAFWLEHTKTGVRIRIVGETNGEGARFLQFKSDRYYYLGLIAGSTFAAVGGAIFAIHYGQATNSQGIGLLIKALFGILAGERITLLLRLSNRSSALSILFGAFALACVLVFSEEMAIFFQSTNVIKETDKQAVIGILLLILLVFREDNFLNRKVSSW